MDKLQKEHFTIPIRDQLRKDGVKLWLPKIDESGTDVSESYLENLSREYSSSLNVPHDICLEILKELRDSSLENFQQQNLFKETGRATLKMKVLSGDTPTILKTEIFLTMSGADLKALIEKEMGLSKKRMKIIYSGKVLNENDSLCSQNVKNGHQLLVMIMKESPEEVIEDENRLKELEAIKKDSKLLALDNSYMQLEDQFGNPVNIPPNEKKSLIVAMTLSEKGKSALKRKEYEKALLFFLEADQEFKKCNSDLLNSVDNYALLDLDIAWCYLCLESFQQLPEARVRLKKCEEKFNSTYGPNLERVVAVKGSTGNEEALLMRLNLLQGIVLYYQNDRSGALELLKKVETQLQSLKVDEQSVLTLMELGYTSGEATIGLRATSGDVNSAANYINETRKKRKEGRKKAIAAQLLERKKKKLGLCDDGKQYVDINYLKMLIEMGYNKEIAKEALKKNNNVISDCIEYIQANPMASTSSTSREMFSLIEDLVPELESAGFDSNMAKLALVKNAGDLMKAADELLSNNGIVLGDLSQIAMAAEASSRTLEDVEEKMLKEEAFDRLKEDISSDHDGHLDTDLADEEVFLQRFLSLLEN